MPNQPYITVKSLDELPAGHTRALIFLIPKTASQNIVLAGHKTVSGTDHFELPNGVLKPGEDMLVCARRVAKKWMNIDEVASLLVQGYFVKDLLYVLFSIQLQDNDLIALPRSGEHWFRAFAQGSWAEMDLKIPGIHGAILEWLS